MSGSQVPTTMSAVLLTGHGGFEKLQYRTDIPVPSPAADQVLIRIGACGVNNTDINTRIGWYSKQVTGDTNTGASNGFGEEVDDDAGWSGALQLPRIQGADCCGEVIAVGAAVNPARIGERVLVRSMQSDGDYQCVTFGSEFDGGFAQYAVARSDEAFAVQSQLTDVELASFPCAYSTAENMVDRVGVSEGDRVLITGASGGVGSAAIQLAKRQGATVIAVCSNDKQAFVSDLGADQIIERGPSLLDALDNNSVDVVIDLVAGPQWPELLEVLCPGGRYAVAGAIAGPIVELDVRTLYLKDITFYGCTWQHRHVFENLIGYIERGEIKPLVSATYPLQKIATAQQDFIDKRYPGKLVLIP